MVGVNDVVAYPGEHVTFFCNAFGSSNLMYRWSIVRGGSPSSSSDPANRFPNSFNESRVLNIGTANLTILRASSQDIFSDDRMIACTVLLYGVELDTISGMFDVVLSKLERVVYVT